MGNGVETESAVILHRHGDGIFSLELNNPKKRNALTAEMWQLLVAHLRILEPTDCRAIILSARGDHFCSGAELTSLGSTSGGQSHEDRTAEGLHLLRQIRVPTIAAIQGTCLGGGLALALACDFQIADTTARFGIPSARLGLVFSVRQTRILVAQIGIANARRLLLLGRQVDAREALAMGLISEVCGAPVSERALGLAHLLAENAPLAVEGSKKIILNAIENMIDQPIGPDLVEIIMTAKNSRDHAEAKRAFSEKRHPVFVSK